MRVGKTSEYAYTILGDVKECEIIYKNLVEVNSKVDYPVTPCGFDCLELAVLEVRSPNFSYETEKFGNIFELGLQWHINYGKEEYIGCKKIKEICDNEIEKCSVGFLYDGEPIGVNSSIFLKDGNEVGYVMYSMFSIKLNKTIGIAMLNNPFFQANLDLNIKNCDNEIREIKTVSAPFVRPLSWDLKMN